MLTFICGLLIGGGAVRLTMKTAQEASATLDPAEIALATRVPTVSIEKVPLAETLRMLSEQWKVPIKLDGPLPPRPTVIDRQRYPKLTDALSRTSIQATDVTLADVLHWVLRGDGRKLSYEVRNDVVHVGPNMPRSMRVYDVHDLVQANPRPLRISGSTVPNPFPRMLLAPTDAEIEVLCVLQDPYSTYAGVHIVGKTLVVNETWDGHRQVVRLLDKLRHPGSIPAAVEPASRICVRDEKLGEWICADPKFSDDVPMLASDAESPIGIFTRVYTLDDWVARCAPQLMFGKKHFVASADPRERLATYLHSQVDASSWDSDGAQMFRTNNLLIVMQSWGNLLQIERTMAQLKAMTEATNAFKPEGNP